MPLLTARCSAGVDHRCFVASAPGLRGGGGALLGRPAVPGALVSLGPSVSAAALWPAALKTVVVLPPCCQ